MLISVCFIFPAHLCILSLYILATDVRYKRYKEQEQSIAVNQLAALSAISCIKLQSSVQFNFSTQS